MSDQTKPNIVYWIIGVVATLWNGFGIFNSYLEYGFKTKPETRVNLGELAEVYGPYYDASPMWLYYLFFIAVITGTIGSIGLLLRKKWATPVLLLSLIAVIIQMGYTIFFSNWIEMMGSEGYLFPAGITLFSAFLYWYAKKSDKDGILA